MAANEVSLGDCPCRDIFNHLTGRWALLVLMALTQQALRFHSLRDCLEGISEKMLSQTLRTLLRDGLIERQVEPSIPPRVSYELTPLGREACEPLKEVFEWIGRRIGDIKLAQRAFDTQDVAVEPGPIANRTSTDNVTMRS